ncbi:glycosyltransferase family 2 protein [Anaerorhabdus sp.]|uniref:glycosyltransferase family 2 protein n=1 Tax=Anaerorhabdus sp. TaxID=1872524 RepID=UPI002FCBBAB6
MNSLVSVIIPTYKGSELIKRAVESVLNQSYKTLEIIIVDDNGKGTLEQISTEKYLEKYIRNKQITYLTHNKNQNGSAARNTGARFAKGEYITLLDDDDEYLPDKIEMQVKCLETLPDDFGMAYCGIELNYESFKVIKIPKTSGDLFRDLLFHSIVIGSDTLMVKRCCYWDIGGFDETFKRHQDFEFTARIAKKWKIQAVSEVGVMSYELNRNNPSEHSIKVSHRLHYVTKMLPYTNEMTNRSVRDFISCNFIMLQGRNLRSFKILMAFKQCKKEVEKILPDYNLIDFFRSILIVEKNKFVKKSKIIKVKL